MSRVRIGNVGAEPIVRKESGVMNFGHVDLKVLLGYPGGLVTLAVGC